MTSKYFHDAIDLGLCPYVHINGFNYSERFRYHLICENNEKLYYDL